MNSANIFYPCMCVHRDTKEGISLVECLLHHNKKHYRLEDFDDSLSDQDLKEIAAPLIREEIKRGRMDIGRE